MADMSIGGMNSWGIQQRAGHCTVLFWQSVHCGHILVALCTQCDVARRVPWTAALAEAVVIMGPSQQHPNPGASQEAQEHPKKPRCVCVLEPGWWGPIWWEISVLVQLPMSIWLQSKQGIRCSCDAYKAHQTPTSSRYSQRVSESRSSGPIFAAGEAMQDLSREQREGKPTVQCS